MTTSAQPSVFARAQRPSLRALILPREHGSWSLALEPLALALLAAPSWPGALLAFGAVALFFARRPWQAARHRDARGRLAITVLLTLGALAIVAVATAMHHARGPVWLALAAAIPAGALFAWFDRRKAGREMAAEIAGGLVFAVFAGAIVLAAAPGWTLATTIAAFAAVRSTTSILAVRTFLRRRKREHVAPVAIALTSALLCAGLAAFALWKGLWVPAAWTLAFQARTIWLVGPRAPAWPAKRIGMLEAALGALAVLTVGPAV